MQEQIKVRIDVESINMLKEKLGKTITKVGYVLKTNYSLSTALFFDDNSVLKIINTPICVGEGGFAEEYPHLSVKKTKIKNDIAYGKEKYEYFDINLKIKGLSAMTDYTEWEEDGETGFYDIENGILIEGEDGQLILYALDELFDVMAVYTDIQEFEEKESVKGHWPTSEKEEEDTSFHERRYSRIV